MASSTAAITGRASGINHVMVRGRASPCPQCHGGSAASRSCMCRGAGLTPCSMPLLAGWDRAPRSGTPSCPKASPTRWAPNLRLPTHLAPCPRALQYSGGGSCNVDASFSFSQVCALPCARTLGSVAREAATHGCFALCCCCCCCTRLCQHTPLGRHTPGRRDWGSRLRQYEGGKEKAGNKKPGAVRVSAGSARGKQARSVHSAASNAS